MKILLVMDPGILVPPNGYGGHERLVYMFANEYRRKGHEVHLLVTEGSEVEGCMVHGFGKLGFPPNKWDARKAIPVAWKFLWQHRHNFDLIHNFGRLVYLLPILNHPVRKIMTYGREISRKNIRWINKLPNRNIVFTGCSNDLVSRGNVSGQWQTVYNAIPFENYLLNNSVTEDAPLIFLGRLERVKGCHTAIKVAKATGNKLIIAGNVSSLPEEQEYYKSEIEPFIDNEQIIYIGQVNDEQKNYYLGKSKALLFPIEWDEPFGMVMAEAMACGTPVIGFRKGSVPEVINHGVSGYIVENFSAIIKALDEIGKIDRRLCREHAQSQFDVPIVAAKYLSI
ncbi:glycosyltransferase [Pontibacter sp. CAU 1760]